MLNITSEQLQSYVRIGLYHVGAFLMTRGYVSAGGWEMWGGVLLNVLTFMWTLWGNRAVAKINEVSKIPNLIVIAPAPVANAVPAENVVSTLSEAREIATAQGR